MAKELMEIGGFITEGAEIVNHDNTLSGNGTVDSPLGVVPFDWININSACTGLQEGIEVRYCPVIKTVQIIGNVNDKNFSTTNWHYLGTITADQYKPLYPNVALAGYSNKTNSIFKGFIQSDGQIGVGVSVTGSQNVRFTTRYDVRGIQS